MNDSDAAVFHRYADYLWRKAGGIVLRWTIAGAAIGGALGSVMLSSWANWPVHHRQTYLVIALGALAGCVLGRSLGGTRAMGLRLQAELAQHQLQFERSTLARAAEDKTSPAPPPYVPAGGPPVSVAGSAQAESVAEVYGWAAMEAIGPA